MKLTLEIKIENLFKANDFTNESGEVKIGKWKIQTFDNVETEQGEKMQLVEVSIPNERYKELKDQVGKVVTIPVALWATKSGNRIKKGVYGL